MCDTFDAFDAPDLQDELDAPTTRDVPAFDGTAANDTADAHGASIISDTSDATSAGRVGDAHDTPPCARIRIIIVVTL
jgi:hypothetical protein